jgi:outer membrane protein TolC
VEAQQKILSLLERRREAGAGTAAESAAARLTLIKVETVAAETERQILLVRQHIGRVLGLSATSLKGVYLLPESATPQSLENKNLPDVRRQSLQTRADVLSALAHYAVAESALALEAERQHPGLHLGPGYQWDQGQNKWTVAFTFELLLFNRNEGPLAEAEAHRHEAAAQLAAIQAQVLAEIESAAAAQTAATEQIASLERVNTEEKKQLALVEARQRAGVSDQLDVQNARLEFATAELALIEGEVQAGISAGQLEDALQIPLANLDALAPAEPAQGVTVSKPQP